MRQHRARRALDSQPAVRVARVLRTALGIMKSEFKLGDSVFDVEPSTILLSVSERDAGTRELFIEVEAVASQVAKDEKWNWSGFPPWFYLRGFPVPDYRESTTHVLSVPIKNDEYEMALYLGEHNDVTDVKIELTAWSSVDISGTVDVMGNVIPFHIQFSVHDARQ